MPELELIYSRHAVHECLRAGRRRVHRILIAEGVEDAPILQAIRHLAQAKGIRVAAVRRHELVPQAQGIAAEVSPYPYAEFEDFLACARSAGEAPLFLVLDGIQDPHNLGNLLRTAEAVGVAGVVIGERRCVGVTPAVVNASSGASEHVQVARVVNLARAVEALKAHDVWVAALHSEAKQTLFEADLRGKLALIVGGEGEGVHRLLRDRADFVLALPMRGKVESLNAAAAGAVALYEALRQRTKR
ncbi:MAG: 23S rRNA (guanosine(2251)-2'-O)-methyltransferase RlmB [Anaerolineae bacterium]|nr:23S rRNA (guanosine(2251)-2'-O)-methyltransferase RlmB [Thermoflexales bacterium]MDW8396642.1 23S rRNA (guanosine(2251)-2'-O)-methyltransferase RlmB [Anaerolineae bacterium]